MTKIAKTFDDVCSDNDPYVLLPYYVEYSANLSDMVGFIASGEVEEIEAAVVIKRDRTILIDEEARRFILEAAADRWNNKHYCEVDRIRPPELLDGWVWEYPETAEDIADGYGDYMRDMARDMERRHD